MMISETYKSGLEESIAWELLRQKVKFKYEPRKIKYFIEYNYIPDFLLPNGIMIEFCRNTEGFASNPETAVSRLSSTDDTDRSIFVQPFDPEGLRGFNLLPDQITNSIEDVEI